MTMITFECRPVTIRDPESGKERRVLQYCWLDEQGRVLQTLSETEMEGLKAQAKLLRAGGSAQA